MVKRHAYLVLVHKDIEQVGLLLRALDHPLNDIFVHADRRFADATPERLASFVRCSSVKTVDSLEVSWGDYSQVAAVFSLLECATAEGEHAYYHFISGQDFPLRSQEMIHAYFNACDKEFIHFSRPDEWDSAVRERVAVPRYPRFASRSATASFLERTHARVRRRLGTSRLDADVRYGFGSCWFSITDALARDYIAHRAWLEEHFSNTLCADELVLQTFALTFGYEGRLHRPVGDGSYESCLRYVDWSLGEAHPATLHRADVESLLQSPYLFARKFTARSIPGFWRSCWPAWLPPVDVMRRRVTVRSFPPLPGALAL